MKKKTLKGQEDRYDAQESKNDGIKKKRKQICAVTGGQKWIFS